MKINNAEFEGKKREKKLYFWYYLTVTVFHAYKYLLKIPIFSDVYCHD